MIYKNHTGRESLVTIPDQIDGEAITAIGAKAFLGIRQIEKLVLPATITEIGDWAFSHMSNLFELDMPANPIRFGKKVFLDCSSLRCIHLFPDHSGNPGLPYFMADIAAVFADVNLLDPVWAVSPANHESWMNAYDTLLISYLQQDDLVGFEPIFYGWVNDEDADVSQKPAYLHEQRSTKVRLAFRRLLCDLHLSDAHRDILYTYLREHMPWGSQPFGHTAVWDYLPEEYGHDIQYYPILKQAGALPLEHIPELVEHLSNASPEVIAWILKYQEENQDHFDFFDSRSL